MQNCGNIFWKEFYGILQEFMNIVSKSCGNNFMSQPLWYNTNILIDRKTVYLDVWDKKGIWLVNDLFYENGKFYEYKQVCEMYELSPLITKFYGVRNSVLKLFEKPCFKRNKTKLLYPYIPQYISIFYQRKKAQRVYMTYL